MRPQRENTETDIKTSKQTDRQKQINKQIRRPENKKKDMSKKQGNPKPTCEIIFSCI